jgi:acetolactate synthase I/III small subunit
MTNPSRPHTLFARHLDRLNDTISVANATHTGALPRETALMKLVVPAERMVGIANQAVAVGARILERTQREIVLELTDAPERVDAFIASMRPGGIAELMRTGRLAMMRSTSTHPGDRADNFRAQADGAPDSVSHEEAA